MAGFSRWAIGDNTSDEKRFYSVPGNGWCGMDDLEWGDTYPTKETCKSVIDKLYKQKPFINFVNCFKPVQVYYTFNSCPADPEYHDIYPDED